MPPYFPCKDKGKGLKGFVNVYGPTNTWKYEIKHTSIILNVFEKLPAVHPYSLVFVGCLEHFEPLRTEANSIARCSVACAPCSGRRMRMSVGLSYAKMMEY